MNIYFILNLYGYKLYVVYIHCVLNFIIINIEYIVFYILVYIEELKNIYT